MSYSTPRLSPEPEPEPFIRVPQFLISPFFYAVELYEIIWPLYFQPKPSSLSNYIYPNGWSSGVHRRLVEKTVDPASMRRAQEEPAVNLLYYGIGITIVNIILGWIWST